MRALDHLLEIWNRHQSDWRKRELPESSVQTHLAHYLMQALAATGPARVMTGCTFPPQDYERSAANHSQKDAVVVDLLVAKTTLHHVPRWPRRRSDDDIPSRNKRKSEAEATFMRGPLPDQTAEDSAVEELRDTRRRYRPEARAMEVFRGVDVELLIEVKARTGNVLSTRQIRAGLRKDIKTLTELGPVSQDGSQRGVLCVLWGDDPGAPRDLYRQASDGGILVLADDRAWRPRRLGESP